MTITLVAILLALACWASSRLLRRRASPTRELEIISRAGLSQKAGLALISLSGRRLLVGYGGESPVLLFDAGEKGEQDQKEELDSEDQSTFSRLLRRELFEPAPRGTHRRGIEPPPPHGAPPHGDPCSTKAPPTSSREARAATKGEASTRNEPVFGTTRLEPSHLSTTEL